MDVDEDDDFYGSGDGGKEYSEQEQQGEQTPQSDVKAEQDEGLEEGEEEDEEGSDSVWLESKGCGSLLMGATGYRNCHGEKRWHHSCPSVRPFGILRSDRANKTHSTSRYNNIRDIPQRQASTDTITRPSVVKKETPAKGTPAVSGSELPGISTSKIDVDAKPIYEPAGKPITQVNIDEGMLFYCYVKILADDDKI